jgi:hypothetical protein
LNLIEIQNHFLGEWAGTNLLRLSWLTPPEFRSDTRMSVNALGRDKFLTFRYTWSHEDTAHEGLLLLGYAAPQAVATAAWVDSWHQSTGILACQGTIAETGVITVQGSYPAPTGPDWGWRIVLTPGANETWQMTMYNITPEGEEDLAVQADYHRVG